MQTPFQKPIIMTRVQAARYLSMSTRTFDRTAKEVNIPFVQLGKRKRYLQSDLEELIMSNRHILSTNDND